MIRVGKCTYNSRGVRFDPKFAGFSPIIVLMKSHSEWGSLGPYTLKNENNQIFENIYQFSKIYEKIPETVQYYSRWDKTKTWNHPAEIHITNNMPNNKYWAWRQKGMDNIHYVRYPVGYGNMRKCKYSITDVSGDKKTFTKLNYIQARKEIYLKEYCRLVKKEPAFKKLKKKLEAGENLLIIEVDGPVESSLPYYIEHYGVDDKFIEDGTMLVNAENIDIMFNDEKHPFGHGYCLALALLGKEDEWANVK